jgi:hypothetical protein
MQAIQERIEAIKSQFNVNSLRGQRNTLAFKHMCDVLNRFEMEFGCTYVIQEAGPFIRHEDLFYDMGFHLTVRAVGEESVRRLNSLLFEVARKFEPSVIGDTVIKPNSGDENVRTLSFTTERIKITRWSPMQED